MAGDGDVVVEIPSLGGRVAGAGMLDGEFGLE